MKKFLITLLFVFFLMPIAMAAVEYDGLVFSDVTDFNLASRGYTTLRLNISNSKNAKRKIKLYYEDYSKSWKTSKSFTIEPKETIEQMFSFPFHPNQRPQLSIEVDGKKLSGARFGNQKEPSRMGYNTIYKQIYLDSNISPKYMERLDQALGGKDLTHDYVSFPGSDSQLYKNWLPYERFAVIIYYTKSFVKLPPPVKAAFLDYVRMGGTLVLIGSRVELPKDFFYQGYDGSLLSYEYEAGFGKCFMLGEKEMTFVESDGSTTDSSTSSRTGPRGRSVTTSSTGTKSTTVYGGTKEIQQLSIMPDAYSQIVRHAFSNEKIKPNVEFSTDEVLALKPYQFAVLVVLFVILLGPVNVWFLRKKAKLRFIFITVPVISLLLCVALGLYYAIFEGGILKVKKEVLILLNEAENKAYAIASYGVFSARNRSDSLIFNEDTTVYTGDTSETRYSRDRQPRGDIILDSGQSFTRGWLKARTPRTLYIHSMEHSREKLLFTNENSELKVVNGLGVKIKELVYRAQDNRLYSATNIAPGSSVVLTRSEAKATGQGGFGNLLRGDHQKWFSVIQSNPNKYLRLGQYRTLLEDSPFLTQSLEKKAKIEAKVYLYGNANVGANL
jgi:hypothetical protein